MENADETLYSKVRTQLVRNTVNTDSSEVDRLYPESIDKTTESANSGLREWASGLHQENVILLFLVLFTNSATMYTIWI